MRVLFFKENDKVGETEIDNNMPIDGALDMISYLANKMEANIVQTQNFEITTEGRKLIVRQFAYPIRIIKDVNNKCANCED